MRACTVPKRNCVLSHVGWRAQTRQATIARFVGLKGTVMEPNTQGWMAGRKNHPEACTRGQIPKLPHGIHMGAKIINLAYRH